MVVGQINVACAAFFKAKDHAPVRPDGHAPEASQTALEGVEPETGEIHVFRLSGTVENSEDILDPLNVIGMDTFRFVVLKKPLQPLVPEAPNHR
jgi:hypothetical protein